MNEKRFLKARYWISGVAAFAVLGVLFLYNLSPVAHIEMSSKASSMVRPVLVAYYRSLLSDNLWYYSLDEQEPVLVQCSLSDRLVFFQTIIATCEMAKNAVTSQIFYELINGDAAALYDHLDRFMQTSEFSRLTKNQQGRIQWHTRYLKSYRNHADRGYRKQTNAATRPRTVVGPNLNLSGG